MRVGSQKIEVTRVRITDAGRKESGRHAIWLDRLLPGRRTSRAIDIRTIDRHPLASVGSLVLGLRCSFCPGSAPMPVIRRIATRYDKLARNYFSALCLVAAVVFWL